MKKAVFIFLIPFIAFLIYSIVLIYQVQSTTQPAPTEEDNRIVCNQSAVLDAWIRERPPPSTCPARMNNLVVAESNRNIELYERKFIVDTDTGCCYFDNSSREIVKIPFVCNGGTGKTFSVSALNTKPYSIGVGGNINVINPTCDGDDSCIILHLDTNEMKYKIMQYSSTSNTADNSALYIPDMRVEIANGCGDLMGIYHKGLLMTVKQANGIVDSSASYPNTNTEPLVSNEIRNIFNNGGTFYPVPSLSEI